MEDIKLNKQEIKKLSIIMKTTENCNLDCVYCYEGEKCKLNMGYGVLDESINKISGYMKNNFEIPGINFIWHGGEPLLLPIGFYKKALVLQDKYEDLHYKNSIQSNLTLFNKEWLDFFKENDFTVGTSLDGPKDMNNKSRGDSFDRIFSSLKLAKKKNYNISAICVLGKHNSYDVNSLYEFFKKEQIDFEVNMTTSDGNAQKNNDIVITPEEYGKAMVDIFDLWLYDVRKPVLNISNFLRFSAGILDIGVNECIHTGNCSGQFYSIDPIGDVYPCGRFNGKETFEFKLGNIIEDNFEDIVNSDVVK
ncbi:radical SAM protein, partial [Nanoarchaeota archaeon]